MICFAVVLLCLTGLSTCHNATISNINAIYTTSIQPFTLDVHPQFEQTIRNRVAETRLTDDLGVPAFQDGPSTSNVTAVRDFWVNSYNWSQVQEEINRS